MKMKLSKTAWWWDRLLRLSLEKKYIFIERIDKKNSLTQGLAKSREFSLKCSQLHGCTVIEWSPEKSLNAFFVLGFQVIDEVNRKKCEYQKHLEYYKLLRSKFEEHYIKGKITFVFVTNEFKLSSTNQHKISAGRGGRKLDDVRDKYQKACRKLHLAHNEYVLLISEASEVENDFRTVLLPGLLEHQQSIQEDFVVTWCGTERSCPLSSVLKKNSFSFTGKTFFWKHRNILIRHQKYSRISNRGSNLVYVV